MKQTHSIACKILMVRNAISNFMDHEFRSPTSGEISSLTGIPISSCLAYMHLIEDREWVLDFEVRSKSIKLEEFEKTALMDETQGKQKNIFYIVEEKENFGYEYDFESDENGYY